MDAQLKKLFEKMQHKEENSDVTTNEAHLSFFPITLRNSILKLTRTDLTVGNVKHTTIVIGTIAPGYPEDYWKKDVAEVGRHFNLDMTTNVHDAPKVFFIKMVPVANAANVLNSKEAIEQMEIALNAINMGVQHLRIVRIGIANTSFFFDAVNYLLKDWNCSGDKYLQFVTTGDDGDNELFEFCKSLCLSEVCKEIEFYNTRDYHPFGYFNSKWHKA
jgi:glutamine synthetase type III